VRAGSHRQGKDIIIIIIIITIITITIIIIIITGMAAGNQISPSA
jgi:hypothetical protein